MFVSGWSSGLGNGWVAPYKFCERGSEIVKKRFCGRISVFHPSRRITPTAGKLGFATATPPASRDSATSK